jgi:hypothetical protein
LVSAANAAMKTASFVAPHLGHDRGWPLRFVSRDFPHFTQLAMDISI